MSIKNANTNLAPKDLADSFSKAMFDNFGEDNFFPMFDTLEAVIRDLKIRVSENLVRERQIAKERVEQAETQTASMISLFDHFRNSFRAELEETLNPQNEIVQSPKLNR